MATSSRNAAYLGLRGANRLRIFTHRAGTVERGAGRGGQGEGERRTEGEGKGGVKGGGTEAIHLG